MSYTQGTYLGTGITITRQLQIEGSPGVWVDIASATGTSYVPVTGQATHNVRLVEIAHNAGGDSLPNISAAKMVVVAPAAIVVSKATMFPNLAMLDIANIGTNDRPDYESNMQTAEGTLINLGCGWIHAPSNFSNAVQEFIPLSPITGRNRVVVPWEQYTTPTSGIDKIPPRGQTLSNDSEGFGPGPLQYGYNKHCVTADNHPQLYFDKTRHTWWAGHGICEFPSVGQGQYIRGFRPPQTQDPTTFISADTEYHFAAVFNPTVVTCLALNWVISYGASQGSGYPSFTMRIFKPTGNPVAPWSCFGSTYGMQPLGLPSLAQTRNEACCVGTIMYLGGGTNKWDGVAREHPGPGPQIAPYWNMGSQDSVLGYYNHGMEDGQELPAYFLADHGITDIPDGTTIYARDCTTHTYKVSATKGGPALVLTNGFALRWQPNSCLYAIDVSTNPPTVTIVSHTFANQTFNASGKSGKLIHDSLRNRLIHIGKTVTACDLETFQWSDVAVANWPAYGYDRVQGFFSAEFDAIYFRGNELSAPGSANYNADLLINNPWQINSIVFPPIRAQIGNPSGGFQDIYVDGTHQLTWDHVGGDYKNLLGVEQSTANPYGTVSVSHICTPAGTDPSEDLSINVTSMLTELFDDNTGIMLIQIGGDRQTRFALNANTTESGSRLVITKTVDAGGGTVEVPLLYDDNMSAPFYGNMWQGKAVAKFDLSGLTRAQCLSASLILRHIGDYFGGGAATIGAFLLNPPFIKDIPQTCGAETAGSSDPAIKIWCNGDASGHVGFSDVDTVVADAIADGWQGPTGDGPGQCRYLDGSVQGDSPWVHQLTNGRGGLTILERAGVQTSCSNRRFFITGPANYADGINPAPTEFYFTVTVKFPYNMIEVGSARNTKLCAPESFAAPENGDNLVSTRIVHGTHSPANPDHVKVFTYLYDAVINATGGGTGEEWLIGQQQHFLLRRGREYTFTQHYKRNTFTDGVANADGQYDVYINWVKMPGSSISNHLFTRDPQSALGWFHMLLYSGGFGPLSLPTVDHEYAYSNILCTTEMPARDHPSLRYIRQN